MKRTLVLVTAFAVMMLTLAGIAGAQGSDEIGRFDDGKAPNGAKANLERIDDDVDSISVYFSTKARGELIELGEATGKKWSVGDATTLWFVVFNNPEACVDGCGGDDVDAIFEDDAPNPAEIGIHYATGSVVTSGHWTAAAALAEGDDSHLVFGELLTDAEGAEVHIVARSHGPAKNLTAAQLNSALTSLEGGCETNTCGDAQFAVFLP